MSDTCIIDVTKMMIIQMCHRSIEATQIGKVSLTKWVQEVLAVFMKNLVLKTYEHWADILGFLQRRNLIIWTCAFQKTFLSEVMIMIGFTFPRSNIDMSAFKKVTSLKVTNQTVISSRQRLLISIQSKKHDRIFTTF